MKKIFLSLITAIAFGVGAMAQDNRVATLQHGNDIQAFYGINALGAAHDAAVEGDIITLSTGEYNLCDITKAITIRGEGMDKTILRQQRGAISFTVPQGSTHALTIEGLKIDCATIDFYGNDGSEKVIVSKCLFYVFWWGDGSRTQITFTKCNATFIQSYIPNDSQSGIIANDGSHVTCINSVVNKLTCYYGLAVRNGTFDVQNCIITDGWGNVTIKYSTIKNTIFSYAGSDKFSLDNTNTSSHCLVKDGNTGFSDSWTVSSFDGIFTNDYHLTEAAAAQYIGTDGTQIGIYGGMYPYDITPDYPLVKRLDVIGSHTDGKLNVKINVE